MLHINNEIKKSTIKLLFRMSAVLYSSFVCISAYANVYFKIMLRECLRAGLPSGFPSPAPPPVLVPAVLGTLAVWIPNQKKQKKRGGELRCRNSAGGKKKYKNSMCLTSCAGHLLCINMYNTALPTDDLRCVHLCNSLNVRFVFQTRRLHC